MRDVVSKLLHKSVLAALGSTLVITGAIAAGVITFSQPGHASAAPNCQANDAYPETNIIWCGLTENNARTPDDYKNNLKAYFDGTQKDGHNNDIHAALAAGGLTESMFTSGTWQLATSFDKSSDQLSPGTSSIVFNGKVIATNLMITSRCPNMSADCSPSNMYSHLEGNVYKRDANWFFAANNSHSKLTLVHFNANGVADFAVWGECSNGIMFKPVTPPSLVCKQLDAKLNSTNDSSFDYTFTVTATVQNTPNITYTINYGDGSQVQSKSVTNGQNTATFTHTYTRLETDKTYTASAQVNGQPQVATCKTPVQITAKKKLVFACETLKADVIAGSVESGNVTYRFTASTQGTDTAKSYQFVFGDNSSAVEQSGNTATHQYTFDTATAHSFTAYFTATSATGLKTDQNDKNCQYSFSTQLVRTGPEGIVGLMAGTSVLGAGIHQFLLRRKLSN